MGFNEASSECRVGCQLSFSMLYNRIHYEEHGERLEMTRIFEYLYNFCANLADYNQICSTFAPWLEAQADNLQTMSNLIN